MELLHKEITHKIIGAAMEVNSILRPGLDEKIYEKALMYELIDQGMSVNSQTEYPVIYKGRNVGTLIPDLVVNDLIIVETKVVTDFVAAHFAQVLGYLNITNLEVGLLVNFKHTSLQHKRVTTQHKPPNLH